MATHSSVLAWRISERSLAGYYCPWSCKELAQEMTLTSTLTLKQHRFEMQCSNSGIRIQPNRTVEGRPHQSHTFRAGGCVEETQGAIARNRRMGAGQAGSR